MLEPKKRTTTVYSPLYRGALPPLPLSFLRRQPHNLLRCGRDAPPLLRHPRPRRLLQSRGLRLSLRFDPGLLDTLAAAGRNSLLEGPEGQRHRHRAIPQLRQSAI